MAIVLAAAVLAGAWFLAGGWQSAAVPRLDDIELSYFPLQGRGEPIRLLLEYYGVPYRQRAVTGEEWSVLKVAEDSPYTFGQLPHLQNGDLSLVQTNAILAHLDRQIRLRDGVHFDEEHLAKQEQISGGVEDLRARLGRLVYGAEADKEAALERLPRDLLPFERLLVDNGAFFGKGHYLVGDSATYVDLNLWDVLDKFQHAALSPDCLKDFPAVRSSSLRIHLT